ncbi:hypothetical protein PVIIG_04382 [Plasmodium vivax India VII]|uniref:Uncharacterized protein n=5 Tax=Plasmodium vivax TaxID=5855 RepID=A0A0J9TDG0_PLAVI|nr:hypothetical protein PVIIG_04382 [Plasmodium vivax India VII]KMZ84097.1 hypothetical protein PVBG_02324 [Plasmodium vivax Brazil I]KMZ93189.1 hypothetical protein PVMG_04935 [Plasmodium vivax Mauritania I]KMZ99681.1 hypothetical protein PVNG_03151 [Plasmodium vivax North Korean]CAI7720429.1 conserved Plasmodium protein, unknown function [Plasmodium vivax]
MNKPKSLKNGMSSEREKLASAKEGDDDEKSDDSDKQIVVVNRSIKSKIFLESGKAEKGEKNCTSNARSARGLLSKAAKKSATICGDAPLAQIIRRDNNNNNNKTGNFSKAALASSQFRGLQGAHTTATPKQQKLVHKSEQKNHIGGPPSGKRECEDYGFFNELMKSTCVNNTEGINHAVRGGISGGEPNEATHGRDLHAGKKEKIGKIGKIGKDAHFDKANEEGHSEYLPPYDERRHPFEERPSHSSQHNTVEHPWGDDPPLGGANPSVHFAQVGEGGGEEEGNGDGGGNAFTCRPASPSATSPVIKYDQFELHEIDRELEKITEEENKIQEKLIYLANQELDIAIKMKQLRAARLLSQKEGQPVEGDRGSHNADKG